MIEEQSIKAECLTMGTMEFIHLFFLTWKFKPQLWCNGYRVQQIVGSRLDRVKPKTIISLRLGFRRNVLSVLHPNLVSSPNEGILEILYLTCTKRSISYGFFQNYPYGLIGMIRFFYCKVHMDSYNPYGKVMDFIWIFGRNM